MLKPIPNKTEHQISIEWDSIAQDRERQIELGIDISYQQVLLPCVKSLIAECNQEYVLDVGCGVGFLTAELSKSAGHVVGVDLSPNSIQIAKRRFNSIPNIKFVLSNIEEFSTKPSQRFTLAVANMTLHTCLNLDTVVHAISSLLISEGHLVFTIPHPWTWPIHAGFSTAEWFNYKNEVIIETPFSITRERTGNKNITYVHRPLQHYVKSLAGEGLVVEQILEPQPTADVIIMYGEDQIHPRFLALKCKKSA